MIRYFERKKARKELCLIQRELVFYEPFYQLIATYESWFVEISNDIKSTAIDMIDEGFIIEALSKITLQLLTLKQVISECKGRVGTRFFEEYIDLIMKMTASGNKAHFLNIMFFYAEIFSGSKRYITLKEKEAELENFIGKF